MTKIDDIDAEVIRETERQVQLRIDRRNEADALGALLANVLERSRVMVCRPGRDETGGQVRSVHVDAAGSDLHAWVDLDPMPIASLPSA